MTSAQRTVAASLVGLSVALLLVGVVSGTFFRHVVQIIPAAVALAFAVRRPAVGAYAAIPIFAFWTLVCILIWLFLLGVSRIARGTYTTAEIVLTLVMVGASVVGGAKSLAVGRPLSVPRRAATILLFAAFQVGAMIVSFLKPIVNR